MTKHTDGPWVISDARSDARIAPGGMVGRYIAHKDGGMVAEAILNCRVNSDAEMEANARLIAAAPDLLAALKLAGGSAGFQYMTHETRDAIDAAIAKATGSAA